MDQPTKNAAILASISALRAILADALERATAAENAIHAGEANQAIGAALGLDEPLQEAIALYTAARVIHRRREST